MRRILSTLLFLLALCSPSWAAYNVVAGRCDPQTLGDGSDLTSTAIDTTGATLIIVYASQYQSDGVTLTDSKSNTLNALTDTGGTTSSFHGRMWYAWGSISVGSGHTFTLSRYSGTGLFGAFICTLALSGAMTASDPLDGSDVSNENSGTTIQTGSISPSVDNEIVVTGLSTESTLNVPTINSGFTVQATTTGTDHQVGGIAYLIQTTKAAVNPTWTVTDNLPNRTTIASFKMAVTAGGASPRRSLVVVQ